MSGDLFLWLFAAVIIVHISPVHLAACLLSSPLHRPVLPHLNPLQLTLTDYIIMSGDFILKRLTDNLPGRTKTHDPFGMTACPCPCRRSLTQGQCTVKTHQQMLREELDPGVAWLVGGKVSHQCSLNPQHARYQQNNDLRFKSKSISCNKSKYIRKMLNCSFHAKMHHIYLSSSHDTPMYILLF